MLNRPYAFKQWVEKANIPEKYVLMSEPDHVMIRPLPNFMTSEAPGGEGEGGGGKGEGGEGMVGDKSAREVKVGEERAKGRGGRRGGWLAGGGGGEGRGREAGDER